MISRFFIDRPVFASVLSILITLAGGISLLVLPIAQYPHITPPTVRVECNYPGASAEVVSHTVAAPIEQEVNGVEGMMYMSSESTNDGTYRLTVTFRHGFDLNMAQVLVQNRVNLALPALPDAIKQAGITTRRKSPDMLMSIAVYSPDSRYDQVYLSNFALMQLKEELARLDGVGDVTLFAQRDYSMRVWADPGQLAVRGLGAKHVVAAVREQNAAVAAGAVGQQPTPAGVSQITLHTHGRLEDAEDFGNIILRATPDGRVLRLKHMARVELGAKNQDITCRVDGKPSVSLTVWQLPGANAFATASRVHAKMDELKALFPEGVDYVIRYDTTPYIRESIKEVFKTLRDAVILVAVVVLLFLQNWRAALIPLIAVPVAIIGTFAVMAALGFSLNNLTLFGLVLAIGIVVDDAIVVVEAIEHHIEQGLAPRAATVKAMEQVSGPVIAVGLVLSAVFVPCAFISGITGQFFRQFALTIAVSTIISAFNSLTLSPALAALLLRPRGEAHEPLPRVAFVLAGAWAGFLWLTPWLLPWSEAAWMPGGTAVAVGLLAGWLAAAPLGRLVAELFRLFNLGFDRATALYTRSVGVILGGRASLVVVACALAGGWLTWELVAPAGLRVTARVGWEPLSPRLPARAAAWLPWLAPRLPAWAIPAAGVMTGVLLGGLAGAVLRRLRVLAACAGRGVRVSVLTLGAYGALLVLTGWGFTATPKGFIPRQDMGYLLVNVQLPDAASPERTADVLTRAERIALAMPGVKHTMSIGGQAFLLNAFGSNFGSLVILLEDFDRRQDPELYSATIAAKLRRRFDEEIDDASLAVFGPPPVRGVGQAGGFKIMVEDRGDVPPAALQQQTENLVRRAGLDPRVLGLSSVFRANVPQLYVDVDRDQCRSKGVDLKDLFDTLEVYLGSLYVNDFNRFGRTWQVIVQAEDRFRDGADDVRRLRVPGARGVMVPLGTLAEVREVNGPLVLTRYNMYPAASINGTAARGVSSGEAIALVQRLAEQELPANMAYEWTDISYLELMAGNTALVIFAFSVVMVFLVLAAQYESWSLPLAVILVVPLCLLSAIVGVNVAHRDINIFTQIGFVVLVGLASKNAILIVEFAKTRRAAGAGRHEATLAACRLRLRPIVMTSLAFVLGVLPLLVSHGAGHEMRQALGTAVFAGMLGVTAFGIFLTPVFFYVIDGLGEARAFAVPQVQRLRSLSLAVVGLGLRQVMRSIARRRSRSVLGEKPAARP